jgi:hypothetical protein
MSGLGPPPCRAGAYSKAQPTKDVVAMTYKRPDRMQLVQATRLLDQMIEFNGKG